MSMTEARKLVVVDEFNGEYLINEAYRPIAQALKDKFPELQHVPVKQILFVDRRLDTKKIGNKEVFAQVSKISTKFQQIIYQFSGHYFYFMIEVFKMSTAHMSRAQIAALLYHELHHIQLVHTKTGSDIKIVGHDIEDWTEMIERLGVNWSTTKGSIPDILDDSVTDWDSIQGPITLFPEANLRLVK